MNTAPQEFTKKDYWNKFSSSLGKIPFEWYGKWEEISKYCNDYVKPRDNVLHVGIGNSDLAAKFYDGLMVKNQLAVDIAEKAIEFQKKQFERDGIIYETKDITKNGINDTFNVIFDKGTLDAMIPENDTSTEIAEKMFENVCNNLLRRIIEIRDF